MGEPVKSSIGACQCCTMLDCQRCKPRVIQVVSDKVVAGNQVPKDVSVTPAGHQPYCLWVALKIVPKFQCDFNGRNSQSWQRCDSQERNFHQFAQGQWLPPPCKILQPKPAGAMPGSFLP